MPAIARPVLVAVSAAAALAAGCSNAASPNARPAAREPLDFHDARAQAAEFIADYHRIALTSKQQLIKREALSSIPAPCCRDYTIATCCCPCNLAKSVWGLTHRLIAEEGQGVEGVREAVKRWIGFTNRAGYAGDSCYRGRCGLSFADDGCGGMDEGRVS